MRLVSIINVWADAVELLPHCVQNMCDCGVNGVIIIWSEASNYGEIKKDYFKIDCFDKNGLQFIHLFQREPFFNHPMNCETDKRNYGLDKARELGFTHFLTMDQDEFYEPEKFKKVRKYIEDKSLKGIVCPSNVYFKSPKLTIGRDSTLVPFIHELQPRIKHEFNRSYPFSWIKGQIRIDPTRSLSINTGVEYTEEVVMHHMSYVRRDIQMKIRNSSARGNIQKSKTLLNDLKHSKEGDFVEFYRATLRRSELDFGIPEFYDTTQPSSLQGL